LDFLFSISDLLFSSLRGTEHMVTAASWTASQRLAFERCTLTLK
jgi:hypothetical protein